MAAAGLSALGLALLVREAALQATTWHVVGFSVFGASLIGLYTSSSLYHLLPLAPETLRLFRRIDHIMIYVLIAGTYTPICLTTLRGPWGGSILGVVWGMALVGFFLKIFWLQAPRGISTALYIAMGWVALVAVVPLADALPTTALVWLLLGGIFYTVGAMFYALKRPTIHPRHFTFHELFHVLVMAGSACHYWLMHQYVLMTG